MEDLNGLCHFLRIHVQAKLQLRAWWPYSMLLLWISTELNSESTPKRWQRHSQLVRTLEITAPVVRCSRNLCGHVGTSLVKRTPSRHYTIWFSPIVNIFPSDSPIKNQPSTIIDTANLSAYNESPSAVNSTDVCPCREIKACFPPAYHNKLLLLSARYIVQFPHCWTIKTILLRHGVTPQWRSVKATSTRGVITAGILRPRWCHPRACAQRALWWSYSGCRGSSFNCLHQGATVAQEVPFQPTVGLTDTTQPVP